ncbi:MAG TPA: hypothetical protein VIO33_23970, partial [Burkholderiaceae bacterium]
GWLVSAPTSGPAKGSNLNVVLIDQTMALAADGKPLTPFRGVALAVPAKKDGTDTAGTMVVGGLFEPHGVPGPYAVYLPANVATERRQRAGPDGKASIEESWDVKGTDGSAMEVRLRYERGMPARIKSESSTYSGAKPDFFRIYRVEVVSDVVRSTATSIDRISQMSFKAAGPQFAPLFDGTEQLISVTAIPSYARQVFLPGP